MIGRLPSRTVAPVGPPGVTSDRVLALVGFEGSHRGEIDSWIEGLRLHEDRSIPWVKMPVLDDPGDDAARRALESRIRATHDLPARATAIRETLFEPSPVRSAAAAGR